MADLRILSLGAGVQSSTLALMIEKGEIPMVDCAIFSDTQSEPQKVMDYLKYLKTQVSYPIYIVTNGNLRKDLITLASGKKISGVGVPFWTLSKNSSKGIARRTCTSEYKIKPLIKKVRELLGYKKGEKVKKGVKVEQLFGISRDEIYRVKPSQHHYIQHLYPLIDKVMRRYDCTNWLEKNNFKIPPRSACTFCPFHSDQEWLEVKKNKKEWKEVIELDNNIRKIPSLRDNAFLHKQRIPIENVNFDKKNDQLDLFNEECSGFCGN